MEFAKDYDFPMIPEDNDDPKEVKNTVPPVKTEPTIPGGNITVDTSGKLHIGVVGHISYLYDRDDRPTGINICKVAYEHKPGKYVTILISKANNKDIDHIGLKKGSMVVFELKKIRNNRVTCINVRLSEQKHPFEEIYKTVESVATPVVRMPVTTFMGECLRYYSRKLFKTDKEEFASVPQQAAHVMKTVLAKKKLALVNRSDEPDFSLLFTRIP